MSPRVVGTGRRPLRSRLDFDFTRIPRPSDKSIPKARAAIEPDREESSPPASTLARSPQHRVRGTNNNAPARQPATRARKTGNNNYEISSTTKTEVTEAGRVNRIFVAVLVDGAIQNGRASASTSSAPRIELDRHLGAGPPASGPSTRKRGDQVGGRQFEIRRSQQAAPIQEADEAPRHDAVHQRRRHVRHRNGVMMLLGLVVLFMVVRQLVKADPRRRGAGARTTPQPRRPTSRASLAGPARTAVPA